MLADRRASSPEEVVAQLLAVQAQDARAVRLSIRSRSHLASSAEVDAALTQRRTLVIGSLQRTTLHLVAATDYWWLHALLGLCVVLLYLVVRAASGDDGPR